MILPTFTEKEFEKEFFEDFKNVLRYMEYKKRKFQKAIRSANHFPIKTKFIEYSSPMKNTWNVQLQCDSKKSEPTIKIILLHSDKKGKRCATLATKINNRPIMVQYLAHFFERCKERKNIQLFGVDLIQHYFNVTDGSGSNMKPSNGKYGSNYDIASETSEGIELGTATHIGLLIKTFITHEMAKGNQVEEFEKLKEIRLINQ